MRIQELTERLQQSWPAKFFQRFFAYDILALAAALSFFTLLSLAPLVVMLLWLTTSLYPVAQGEFFHQIGLLAGPQVEQTARLIVANAEQQPGTGSLAAILGTAALLVGASMVFGQLQVALNRVFRSDATRLGGALAWLRKRLLSFGMALGVGFLLVVSMAAQAALAIVLAWLPDLMPVLAELVSFLLYAIVFSLIYRLLPDRPVSRRRALLGGAMTSVLFMVGRWAIGLYLGQSTLGNAYGPAGGLVVMLVWLYYCAVVFLVGALITAMLDEHARVKRRLADEHAAAASEPASAADGTERSRHPVA
ncbi:YihY/virulence factor BrkB family protein [Lysobacter sp. A03]|uniref:YihY/virulence factor BrkB family protein n=1 Tax=Lysobacter sp. A03 TaxID=1199154 RepID=UPI0005B72647|nr:YihY/virulence factor BrkB family protein [Lysobacter sp. A03]KIQ96381.1 Inner membrane protein YihY, formerly thought to be RNase BN [Lysobacter sp. A03]